MGFFPQFCKKKFEPFRENSYFDTIFNVKENKPYMNRYLFLTLLLISSLFSQDTSRLFPDMQKQLILNNAILANFNDKIISVVDVMKKMDFLFYQSYPNLAESKEARYQFYQMSWRHALEEMINNELILTDAIDKELKLTDSEIREEMENRYGPNILLTLDKVKITYDEAWKMVKEEMLVQRMGWYRVNSKALQNVTPQKIREAYRLHCSNNPPKETWQYQIISLRGKNEDQLKNIAEKAYDFFLDKERSPNEIKDHLETLIIDPASESVQISNTYETTKKDLSLNYYKILSHLGKKSYSKPVFSKKKYKDQFTYRIFYLKNFDVKQTTSFEEMSNQLKNTLLKREVEKNSKEYLQKLKNYYGIDHQISQLPQNFQPFIVK